MLRPVQNLGKLPHPVKPLEPYLRIFPWELQVLLLAFVNWEEEDPKAVFLQ